MAAISQLQHSLSPSGMWDTRQAGRARRPEQHVAGALPAFPLGPRAAASKEGSCPLRLRGASKLRKNRPQNRKGIACSCVTTPSSPFCFLPNYLISECPLQNETEIKSPKPTHQAGGSPPTQMSKFSRKTGGACLESRALGRSRRRAPGSRRK